LTSRQFYRVAPLNWLKQHKSGEAWAPVKLTETIPAGCLRKRGATVIIVVNKCGDFELNFQMFKSEFRALIATCLQPIQ
jgi:hypothetical protein